MTTLNASPQARIRDDSRRNGIALRGTLPAISMAATVRFLLAARLGALTEPALAALQMMPTGLDVLLAAVQGAETQVHGHGRRPIATRQVGEDDPKKAAIAVQVVMRGMPGEQACLADLVQRQDWNRGVTLLSRPRGREEPATKGRLRESSVVGSGFRLKHYRPSTDLPGGRRGGSPAPARRSLWLRRPCGAGTAARPAARTGPG